jgi:hypothetical protein
MRIYVDSAIHSWRGKLWCHMFSANIDDLHVFAERIGLRREWFQDPLTMPKVSWPHFDCTAERRKLALQHGAIALGRHQTVALARVAMNRYLGLEGTDREVDPLAFHRRLGSAMLPRIERWMELEMRAIGPVPVIARAA